MAESNIYFVPGTIFDIFESAECVIAFHIGSLDP